MLALANAMCGTRRLKWKQALAPRALVLLPLALAATACVAAAAGAGAAVAFGGAAALTSSCYDRVSLRLTDGVSGQVTCSARVSAVNRGGSELVFRSCYHAAVPPGEWTVRADLPGYATATTPLIVPVESQCDPAVQTIELTIAPAGYRPPEPQRSPAPAPTPTPTSTPSPTVPAAPSAAPAVPSASSSAAPLPSAGASSPSSPSPVPPPSAAPPTGAFPAPASP